MKINVFHDNSDEGFILFWRSCLDWLGLADIFLVWCKLARKGKNKNKRATFRAQYMLMLVGERNATVPIDCYLHIVTTAQ